MRNWLKQLRKKRGLTQAQVASGAYINRAYYSQIEQGIRNPSLDVAKGIAEILDFNPSRFFVEDLNVPFEMALKNAPLIIAHCDLELRYTWIYNPQPDFDPMTTIGKRDDEVSDNEGIAKLTAIKKKVIEEGCTIRDIITFPFEDGDKTYHVFAEPLKNDEGKIIGVVTTSMDITEFRTLT